METVRLCKECGSLLAADAPEGLCPRCLVNAGLSVASGPLSFAEAAASQPPSADHGPRTSIRYFGDYELNEEIARGGMGVVYRARQVTLNRLVALKMILAGRLATEAEVKRFHTEAEAAANLDHPNIVSIHEIGKHEGQHYFSMRLVDGESLSHSKEKFTRDAKAAARLLTTVARAVHYGHQRGILHRDLKPANILIDKNGQPHVTDFGLAKRIESASDLTHSGAVLGTPNYMAPEQAQGRTREVSTAADIYSLGAILYELLTGRVPFPAETPLETMRKAVEEVPVRPSAINRLIDRDLETICLKCLEKDSQRRYGSAEALAEDLDRWLRHEPILARRSGPWERGIKWVKRKPALAALIGASVLILALAGLVVQKSPLRGPSYGGKSMAHWVKRTQYEPLINLSFHGRGGHNERAQAFHALANIGPPAVPALTGMLKDPDPTTRWLAAQALAQIGPPAKAAAPLLLWLVRNPREPVNVQMNAIKALTSIGVANDEFVWALIAALSREEMRPSAQIALIKLGPKAEPALRRALLDPQIEVRHAAAEMLKLLDATGVEFAPPKAADLSRYLSGLADQNHFPRFSAAQRLAKLGESAEPAVPALAQALTNSFNQDSSVSARWAAAQALKAIGVKAAQAVPALTEALRDGDASVRQSAADALGTIGPPASNAVPALLASLKDPSTGVQLWAIQALRQIRANEEQALPALLEALSDNDIKVREAALGAIQLKGLTAGSKRVAVPAVIERLGDRSEQVRNAASETLGYLNTDLDIVVPALLALTRDSRPEVRYLAIETLGRIGPPAQEAVPQLIAGLTDENQHVRRHAALALMNLGPAAGASVPALLKALKDRDPEVARLAGTALKQIDREAARNAGVK